MRYLFHNLSDKELDTAANKWERLKQAESHAYSKLAHECVLEEIANRQKAEE